MTTHIIKRASRSVVRQVSGCRILSACAVFLALFDKLGFTSFYKFQVAPRWPQDGPRWPQDGPKMNPRSPQDGPRWPKMAPSWAQDRPKMGPRWPQDRPRWPQEPKTAITLMITSFSQPHLAMFATPPTQNHNF